MESLLFTVALSGFSSGSDKLSYACVASTEAKSGAMDEQIL